MRGAVGLGRGTPARREPVWWLRGPYSRAWRQKVARWAFWRAGCESHLADPVGRDSRIAAECTSSACLGAWHSSGGPGGNFGTCCENPGRRRHLTPQRLDVCVAPSASEARGPREGRGDLDTCRAGPQRVERAHTRAEENDRTPRHDRFLGIRVGEASNPGPAPLGPWEPDPAFTSRFATFGEGWVVFVYLGVHDRDGSPSLSFRAGAPLGGKVATFHVLGAPIQRPNYGEGLRLRRSQARHAQLGRGPRVPRRPPRFSSGCRKYTYGPFGVSLDDGGPKAAR